MASPAKRRLDPETYTSFGATYEQVVKRGSQQQFAFLSGTVQTFLRPCNYAGKSVRELDSVLGSGRKNAKPISI
jgi:hypothetical protein